MPFYHFKVTCNGRTGNDLVRLEFGDLDEAWEEATVTFGELVRDVGGKLIVGSEWAVEVLDEQHRPLRLIRVFLGDDPQVQLSS